LCRLLCCLSGLGVADHDVLVGVRVLLGALVLLDCLDRLIEFVRRIRIGRAWMDSLFAQSTASSRSTGIDGTRPPKAGGGD
jgi:hypothetical protein